jgi:hypothetical protein
LSFYVQKCSNLTGIFGDQELKIPNTAGYLFCVDMFEESGITPPNDPPVAGDSIPIKRG